MIDFLVRHRYTLLLFGLWFAVGRFFATSFIALGLASVLLLWLKQRYTELLLGFFFILILSDNLYPITDFAKVFKNFYIVLIAAIAFLDRRKAQFHSRLHKYFFSFLAVSLVGLTFSPYPFVAFQKWLSYLLLLYAVPQLFLMAFERDGPLVVKDFIFTAITLIIIGYTVRYIDPGLAYSHGGRFRGLFGNPNGLGIFCTLIFGLAALSREYFRALFSKADLWYIFLPLTVAVFLSGSRTALVAIGLFVLFTRFYRLSPILGFIGFLGTAFAIELLSANIDELVRALGLGDYLRIETLEEGSGRYVAWSFAWNAIQDSLWFGRGFAFDEWLMSRNQDLLNDLGHQGGVHNTYLIVWLNSGLVGLLLFIRAFFLLFLKGSLNTALAFPICYMVLFSITLEPWLAASLNPYTSILLLMISILTVPVFQSYHAGERSSLSAPHEEALAA